ncbi:unnamed protein product [Dibothriocephalus latus]|uniref:Uncharacterized protein n=1 Tax=Dibothriocephalus latus TaxID=60516 RepID=A0A3P7LZQ4_DIBLA|nr:unnamed protein product [Dibothriocephalus latus]
MPGYQLFWKDREGRQGGGVLTYVKIGLIVLYKTDKFTSSSEAIWLFVKGPGSSSLDVLTLYRPPRRDPVADASLLEELEKISTRSDILMVGNFNVPHIDWSSACAHGSDLAFDSCLLSMTMNRIGVRGRLLAWIENFLIGRPQTVHLNDKQSAKVAVESGGPQGSVIGTILFTVYINNCVSKLDCDIAMFANDIKLCLVISTAADEELQANLNRHE